MGEHDSELTDSRRMRVVAAVAGLPRPEPPTDLALRTLRRISVRLAPIHRQLLVLRPITNPLARVLAAAVIMLALFPMTDMQLAAPLGMQIEQRLIGRKVIDQVESFVDRLLVRHGPASYSQADLDALLGVTRFSPNCPHKSPAAKPHS